MSLPKSNHNYKTNLYIENYTPIERVRDVQDANPCVVVSHPIVVNEVVRPNCVLNEQTLQAINTVIDGDLLTLGTFDNIPLPDSDVFLSVNGVETVPAPSAGAVATSAFFITDSTGSVVKTPGTYVVGDQFRWNQSQASMQIETTDNLVLSYEIAGP